MTGRALLAVVGFALVAGGAALLELERWSSVVLVLGLALVLGALILTPRPEGSRG